MGRVYDLPYDTDYTNSSVQYSKGFLMWKVYFPTYGDADCRALARTSGVKAAAWMDGSVLRCYFASSNAFNIDYSEWIATNRFNHRSYASEGNRWITTIQHTSRYSSNANYPPTPYIEYYSTYNEMAAALEQSLGGDEIRYVLTNCSAPNAPTTAQPGSRVTVPFVMDDGYDIVNSNDVYVMNNNMIIPSEYSNGVLTFTMPIMP